MYLKIVIKKNSKAVGFFLEITKTVLFAFEFLISF